MTKHLSKSVAIVGAAESDLGKVPGMTSLDLQAQAAARAPVSYTHLTLPTKA